MERSDSTEEEMNKASEQEPQEQTSMELSAQSTQDTCQDVKDQGLPDARPAQTNVLDPRLQPFEEQFPRIVRTFQPQNKYDVELMAKALDIAVNLYLTEEGLLELVGESSTQDAIMTKLITTGFIVGFAVLLARVLTQLLGIQPVAIGQAPQEVLDVIEGIRQMGWPAEPRPGTKIDLPPLNVSAQQRDRFKEGFIIYRKEFEQVYDRAAEELTERGKKKFHDSMPVYVHGPKGIGKSHALRYVATRLWRERLCNDGDFGVLYIAQWHDMPIEFLKKELRLCFHDDPVMLRKIDAVETAANLNVLKLLVQYKSQRVVVILDQAYDTTFENTANSISNFFPIGSFNARIVFASSPRFKLQGYYLSDNPRRAILVPFMAALTPQECISMVLHRKDEALEAIQKLLSLLEGCSDEVWNGLVVGVQRDPMITDETDPIQQQKLGCAIVQLLLETAGGVPLYVRNTLNQYRNVVPPEGSTAPPTTLKCVRDACELFDEAQAAATQTETLKHFGDVDAGYPEKYLLHFLARAIQYGRLPELRPTRDQWSVYDLRYVRLLPDDTLHPLCPAVLRGISRAMMQIALETDRQDSSETCFLATACSRL